MLAQSGTLAPLNQKQQSYGLENGSESRFNSTSTSSRPAIPPSDGFARPSSTSAMTAGTQLMPNAMPPARTNSKGRESPSYDAQSRQTRASGSAVPPALARPFGQRQDSSDLPVNPLFGLGEQIRVKEIGSSRLLVQRAGNVVREGYTTRSVTPPDGRGSRNSNKERPRRPDDHDEHWHDRILAKAHEWGLAGALVDGQDDPDRGRTLYLPVPSTSAQPTPSKPTETNGIRHEGYATQVENFKDNEDQQDHFDAARMKLRSLHSEVHELLENAGFRTPDSEKRPEVTSPQLAFVHDDRPVSPAASSLQHQPSFYSATSDIYASASETGHTSFDAHDDTAVIPPRTDSPLSFATLSEGAASTSTYPPRTTATSTNGTKSAHPDESASSNGGTASVVAADLGSIARSTSAAVRSPPAPIPALVVADATPPIPRTLPTRRSSRPSQSPPRAAGEPYLGPPAVSVPTVTSSPPQAYTVAAPTPRRSATADSSALLTTPPVGPDSPQSSPATITSRRFSSTSTSTGRLAVPGMAPRSQSFSPGTPVMSSSQLGTPEQAVHTGPGTPPTTSMSYPPVGTITQPLLLDDVETSIAAQAEMIRRQRQEKRLEAEKEQAKRDRALQLERERAAGAKKERKPSDGSMAAPIEDKLPSGPGALIRRRVSRMGSGSSQPDASGSVLHGREASANGRDESTGRRGRGGSGHEGDRAGMGVLVGNLIGQDHANYVLMYNMLTGIRIGVSRCQAKGKRPLTDADYTARHKFSFDIVGNELTPSVKYDFKFKDYAPWVFRELREYFYLDPSDYLISLTAKYILSELGSPGKSGSFFYFSRDYRFIIKTIRHSEHKFLRSILKDYHEHVKKNPHTLLSRFYGLHRVKLPRGKKIHFVIMNNLFPPHRDIHETYDLKGSAIGRLYPEDKAQQNPHATLKDLNWVQRHRQFWLGPEKKVLFEEQLRRDTELLQRLGIMDYSLLTGIHNLFKGNSEGLREDKLTVFQPDAVKVSRKATQIKRDADATALRKAVERSDPQALGGKHELPQTDSSERRLFIFYQDEGGMRATGDHNEELGVIYYLGIIDILTPYTLVKRIEHFFKGMKHNKHMISAVHPREYGDRFLAFIKSSIRGNDESIRPQMYEHEKKRATTRPTDSEKGAVPVADDGSSPDRQLESSAQHTTEKDKAQ